jgi:AcrR family transcriptional regulator
MAQTATAKVKTYNELRNLNNSSLRQNVVDTAALILVEEGAKAVTVRNVADRLECSTKIIYSMFGSKDGLANELYLNGCHILRATIDEVKTDSEPKVYLANLGWAYWKFAQDNPNYYDFMFGGPVAAFKPDENSLHNMATTLQLVIQTCEDYIRQGLLTSDDPLLITRTLWSALHGVINLYFGQHFEGLAAAKQAYDFTLKTVLAGLFK